MTLVVLFASTKTPAKKSFLYRRDDALSKEVIKTDVDFGTTLLENYVEVLSE